MGPIFSNEARKNDVNQRLPPNIKVIYFDSPNKDDKHFAHLLAADPSCVVKCESAEDLSQKITPCVVLFSSTEFKGKSEHLQCVLKELEKLDGVVVELVEEMLSKDSNSRSLFITSKQERHISFLTEKWANSCVNTNKAKAIAVTITEEIEKRDKKLTNYNKKNESSVSGLQEV